jgi:hypothetical protein
MTVRNLTVNGASNGSGCQPFNGIAFTNAGGAVSNVTVHDIRWNGYSGCQSGLGIIVDDRTSTVHQTVSITGNTVDTYNKNGITVRGNVSSVIAHNTVVGAGPLGLGFAAQNGVQVSYGASATVTSNTVRNNWYTGPTYTACGLLFYQAGGVKQSANVFSGNQTNICNAGRGGGNTRP